MIIENQSYLLNCLWNYLSIELMTERSVASFKILAKSWPTMNDILIIVPLRRSLHN